MESKIRNGYLLLADLTGYTKFLASSELEHAQEILSELINVVTKNLKTLLTIAEIEGDAVFAYALEDQISRGETLLELVENTYFSFSFHKQLMQDRTTCTCKACQSIGSLDLKFINHFGSYSLQNYSGIEKPLGNEVNLIHRLLKNYVKDKTGVKSYSLFTKSCFFKLDMPPELFSSYMEDYEDFGKIEVFVMNLMESYKRLLESNTLIISEEEADFTAQYQFEMTAPVLWEWLTDNSKRNLWMTDTKWSKGNRPKGRTAAGATNHCAHGKENSLEVILDWKPFKYYTYEIGNKTLRFIATSKLLENDNGTELHDIIKLKNKLPKFFSKFLTKLIANKVMHVYECYKRIAYLHKSSINVLQEKTQ
jgi:hypothetical protein